ncbi:MAG: class I SAM-dependent methyltransferase [Bacteroidetes bacterium]|nr:class I SAM-dependent methyltransferase [Bacteroidota bacterium]
MTAYDHYFTANKDSWNKRTVVHRDSAFYDLDAFKNGQSSLNAIELNEVGDVKEKTLLHLQCHFGMDTMSWERKGAIVTGIDLSDEAIRTAKGICTDLNLSANFVCCNVYDTAEHVPGLFDVVFTSYGTIGWLPDLKPWAEMIAAKLKPGGFFYIADFHPTLWMLDDNMEKMQYSYFNDEVIVTQQQGTYADRNAPIQHTEYGWNHPFAEILCALIDAGLHIDFLHEFSFSPYNCFANMEQGTDGMWRLKGKGDTFPMMYSIKATKK